MIGREIDKVWLFIHKETLSCGLGGCICCLYKLSPNGKLGDLDFPPNVRPELCPRATLNLSRNMKEGIYWNKSTGGQSILTCGDGDFSFSLSLSKCSSFSDEEKHNSIVATSHETYESILNTYGDSVLTALGALKKSRVNVLHGVDATNLDTVAELEEWRQRKFDKIIWNFPCVGQGLSAGADGQSSEMEENKQLVRDFFNSARAYLKKDGEIHVAHKTIEPFCWWEIHKLAKESGSGLDCVASLVFDRMLVPGYVNRKALHKKSFPSHDAQTYVYKFVETLSDSSIGTSASGSIPWLSECEALSEESIPRIYEQVRRALTVIEAEKKKKKNPASKKRKWSK